MRIAVRLVAVMLAGLGLLSLFAFLVLGHRVGFAYVVRSPSVTAFTILAWVVTTVGGPVAAVQLWRSKNSGWTIGLVVFALGLVADIVAILTFPKPGVRLSAVTLNTAFDLVGIIILGSTFWRRGVQVSNFAVQQTGARNARSGC